MTKVVRVLTVVALLALTVSLSAPTAPAQGPVYSVWLVRNSVFKDVPAGAFMPDRVFVPGSTNPQNNQVFFQLPVNVGVIKGGNEIILYDTGWKQQDYLKMTNSVNWAPMPDQLKLLGIQPGDVTKIVIGHGHWDHAGTIMDFPNAVLYVQKAELEGIEWALNYQGHPKISAVNVTQGGCMRSPACGFEPLTLQEIYGKILSGKAVIVDGMMEIAPGHRHPSRPSGPHGRLAAPRGAHGEGQARVRKRRVLLVGGHPRLDDRQPAADRHGSAVPRLREVLQDHGGLRELRGGARAPLLLGRVSAHQELVGRAERLAPGRGHAGARGTDPQAVTDRRCSLRGEGPVSAGRPAPRSSSDPPPMIPVMPRAAASWGLASLTTIVALPVLVLAPMPRAASGHDPSAYGGLFRSRDDGATWLPANPGRIVSGAIASTWIPPIRPTSCSHRQRPPPLPERRPRLDRRGPTILVGADVRRRLR